MRESLAFLATVLIWGSTWYAIKFQIGVVPATWSVAYRFLIAAAVLVLLCFFRRQSLRFTRQDHFHFMGLGLCLFSLNYTLIYQSSLHLSSGLVALGFSCLGIMNIFNGRVFMGQKIDPLILGAALVGILGLGLIFAPEIDHFSLQDASALGLLLCLMATYVASLGNIIASNPRYSHIPLFPKNAWGMLYGTAFNAVFASLFSGPPALDGRLDYWSSLLFLSLFGTVIAFSLYLWLIKRIGSTPAAYSAVLTPVVALVISSFYEGFHWSLISFIGIALVISGNVLMNKRRQVMTKKAALQQA